MNASHAASTYASANMKTASGLHLVVQAYRLTLDHLHAARDAMAAGRLGEKGERVGKAMHAIMELRSVLDKEQGGEVAEQLERLYVYFIHVLTEANIANDLDQLDGAVALWSELMEAWRQASCLERT
ncbi:MAG: flagellar export chaperone FliS [Acidobacteriota bacterium]